MSYDFLLDFETFSKASIETGPNRYASDKYAGVWCGSWGVKSEGGIWGPPRITIFDGGVAGAAAVEGELRRQGFDVRPRSDFEATFRGARRRVAHNAPFERAVLRWRFGLDTPVSTWSCTLARSTRLGLPPALEGVLGVLRAPVRKDLVGNALSKKMGKPIGFRPDGSPLWLDDFASVVRCSTYCVSDYEGQAWLDATLPELEPAEQGRFERQTIENERGIAVDWDLVSKGRSVVRMTMQWANQHLPTWTNGAVTSLTQHKQLIGWVRRRGVEVESLDAETVDLILDSMPDMPEDVRRVLEVRRSIRTSTSKLEALLGRRMPAHTGAVADRVCDLTQYGGARTLRTVGRGFQPLNLPRAGDVDVDAGLAALRRLDWDGMCNAVAKEARERHPSNNAGVRTYRTAVSTVIPTEVVSACLRGTLVPSKKRRFGAADYTGVEFRATLALAGQMDALLRLREGADLYCDLATVIYGYLVSKKEHPSERQLGKQGCLGCGFGLSNPDTFMATCAQYGLYISRELAQNVIDSFAKRFDRVPVLWRRLHSAAKEAMANPGTWCSAYETGVSYCYLPNGLAGISWLQCWLPSGRMMYYPAARTVAGIYGPSIQVMSWKNKRWIPQILSRQVTVENVIQAICRDMMENDKENIIKSGMCDVVLTIYDEIVGEFDEDFATRMVGEGKRMKSAAVEWLENKMSTPLEWFPMMPRASEGWTGTEFKKA